MRRARPFGYALFSLAATACIVACAGRGGGTGGTLPAVSAAADGTREQAVARPLGRDLGRRAKNRRIDAVIALRFRDEAALAQLASDVSDPHSGRFRHFLRPSDFVERFAPTPAAHAQLLAALRAAGFTIDRTFANRAVVDASAPSVVAERFFATRIHDFDQGKYGTRFASVSPVHVPAKIASLVASVELSSLVYAGYAGEPQVDESDSPLEPDTKTNLIVNGGFEERMTGWQSCGKSGPYITTQHPFEGKRDALAGSKTTSGGDVTGWSAICQRVTIPSNAKLSARLYDATDNPSIDDSFQAVGLMNKPGHVVAILRKSLRSNKKWVKKTFDLSQYAGRTTYIFFGVRGKGQKKFYDMQYVDAVKLTGTLTPTPTPSPTPSTSPSPTPSSAPTGPVGPGTDPTLIGPAQGPQKGWEPRGVADGFDFPVQHGYAGTGSKVGIVIDQKANEADLTNFYAYNRIAARPLVTYEPIGTATPPSGDRTEATLDIEGVTGLAPGARVVVYLTFDLSNESIINAYNQVLSDAKVNVLDSSFGECESEDANFVTTTDQQAEAGAVLGITFVAAAGDEGSACYNGVTNVIGVNAPASGPHFLAVGANQSLSSGPIANPAVWNDRTSGTGSGIGGGGISESWPLPAYQLGLAGAPASATKRNVPDVAFPGVDDDIFIFGTDQLVEGTSWSSAIASALLASTVQFCGNLGWVNPAVYAEYAKSGETRDFADVTHGFNGDYAGSLTKGYSAATGYDNASGIGMPQGIKFGASLCGRGTPLLVTRPPAPTRR